MGQAGDLGLGSGHPFALLPQNRTLLYAAYETLVGYGKDLAPKPVLAERFELSADFTRLAVTLRPGLEFHNGAPVTADDVLFGIEVMQHPEQFKVAGRFELAAFAKAVQTVRRPDPRTLEFTFDRPRPNIIDFFAQLEVTHRESYASAVANRQAVGTGPFRLRESTAGRGYALERFPNWHESAADRPLLDSIDVTLFADQSAAALAFEAGSLDAYLAMGAPQAARFRAGGRTRVTRKAGVNYLGVNVANPMLRDARVRRAFLLAVDRARIGTEALFELACRHRLACDAISAPLL